MSERPIIFSSGMVRAILEDRKTQTRRVIKNKEGILEFIDFMTGSDEREGITEDLGQMLEGNKIRLWSAEYPEEGSDVFNLPYDVGDRLWVRESFAQILNQEGCLHEEEDFRCPCKGCHIEYKTDSGNKYPGEWPDDFGDDPECPKWKPSIHMPRWASRITLEITDIRVERLQNIYASARQDDLWKEGLDLNMCNENESLRDRFVRLWNSLHKKENRWEDNPWVWVIEFKKL